MLEIYSDVTNIVLCNNIVDVEEYIEWENVEFDDEKCCYVDEDGYPLEIYQYYLTNNTELFEMLKYPVAYSNVLDCDIVGITHWGTRWNYVMTNQKIEDWKNWFSNYEEKNEEEE